jgi:transcriptional repressor NrdR
LPTNTLTLSRPLFTMVTEREESNMRCPFCQQDSDRVIDSRLADAQFAVRRRRECSNCNRRFTTYERIEESVLKVIKKDGRRVNFDRGKVMLGLVKACEKRPISTEDLENLVGRIEGELIQVFEKEVPSQKIGEKMMDELRALDHVAYVRFASVYREFKDVNEFVSELKTLEDKKK